VIDAPTWTFDYGFDPKMGEAIGAISEAAAPARHLESHVAHLRPFALARLGLSHDRRDLVETAATEPQLAIYSFVRQRLDETCRRRHDPAAPVAQDAPVPDGAHAVVFLG